MNSTVRGIGRLWKPLGDLRRAHSVMASPAAPQGAPRAIGHLVAVVAVGPRRSYSALLEQSRGLAD